MRGRSHGRLLAGAAALALAGAPAVPAAVFPVGDAAGLIAAIDAANADPAPDVIELEADVTLAAVHDVTTGPTATPPIVTPIELVGHGFTIARAAGAPALRLFLVRGGGFFGDGALTLDGVRLAGGDVSTIASNCFTDLLGCGGAVLSHFGELTVRGRTVFDDNGAVAGGAIFNAGGNAAIADATFTTNRAERGGALYNVGGLIGDPATIVVRASRFVANTATLDGGAIHNEAELDVVDATFTDNAVTAIAPFGSGGGALYNTSVNGLARIVGSRFEGNVAPRGGALSNYNASDLTLENCDVAGNRTPDGPGGVTGGGGIWSDNNGTLIVRNSRVVGNATPDFLGHGGGIFSGSGLNNALVLEGSVVTDNVAGGDGGGIYLNSGNAGVASTITDTRIDGNRATGEGGGLFKRGASPLTIVASSISDNVATGQNGGGIAVEGGSAIPPVGVVLTDSTIARNRIETGDGGGVSNEDQGVVTIRRCTIADNAATGVGGVSGLGAGVYGNQTNSTLTIENSTVSGNRAQGNGGGLYNSNASQMTVRHVTIAGNRADLQGGGIVALGGTMQLAGSLVVGNLASHPVNPPQHNCAGLVQSFADLGGNFTDDVTNAAPCPAGFTLSDDVALLPRADTGGPTATHALAPGSDGIDAVPACGLATDQRGVPRAAACDAGAWDGAVVVPVVQFASAASSVDETSGPHDVAVVLDNRLGTIPAASATVHVALVGTAGNGVDYDVAVSPPLVFTGASWPAPGDGAVLHVTLEPLADARVEPAETIRLELRDAGIVGPADLGARDVHTVTLADACPPAPEPSCRTGFGKGRLTIDERTAGKEKLAAQLSQGPATTQADFGDPILPGGTAYRLCVYDDQGTLAGGLLLDRAGAACGSRPCWKPLGAPPPAGKGYRYTDKTAAADGLKAVKLKGGRAGKSQITLNAANTAGALPGGVAAALLPSAGGVTVQLLSSDAACFARTLTAVSVRDGSRYQAK